MQFVKLGEFFAAVKISGITHNLLKLRLTDSGQQVAVSCERLPATGRSPTGAIDEHALVESVLGGVRRANERLGTSFRVTHIQYVEDDSPPESTYGELATRIVEHLHAGHAWTGGGGRGSALHCSCSI